VAPVILFVVIDATRPRNEMLRSRSRATTSPPSTTSTSCAANCALDVARPPVANYALPPFLKTYIDASTSP